MLPDISLVVGKRSIEIIYIYIKKCTCDTKWYLDMARGKDIFCTILILPKNVPDYTFNKTRTFIGPLGIDYH